jgi:uncharacterized repeat protein (TIGR01451 family)
MVNCAASYVPPPPLGFALSLKKYVNSIANDAQPSAPVYVKTGDALSYIIRVTNNGPGVVIGQTTVNDLLPLGVIINDAPTGTGWTCTVSGISITCKSSAATLAGYSFADITIPVKVTATSGMITNTALVSNPDDSSSTPGDNTDPGVIIVDVAPVCSATISGSLATTISSATP